MRARAKRLFDDATAEGVLCCPAGYLEGGWDCLVRPRGHFCGRGDRQRLADGRALRVPANLAVVGWRRLGYVIRIVLCVTALRRDYLRSFRMNEDGRHQACVQCSNW